MRTPKPVSPFYLSDYHRRLHEERVRHIAGRWTFILLGAAVTVGLILKFVR